MWKLASHLRNFAPLLGLLGALPPALASHGPATRPAAGHWSFVAPKRPETPVVKEQGWCRNPIDHFVLAQLEAKDWPHSPAASRETLLRRVSLDLIGLPPTPAEMDAFLADNSPDAYQKVVDRLLASPHYGERWGRHWLDGARYADSNGYSQDNPRSIWKYRDWVIDAVNRDMPFDEFTIAQLAGDMLPNATVDQKIATGFHRNTQINQEGGIDPEQFRVESIIDRVSTTGTVFLGLTIGCAQCHNHKFDPISQKDYYSFFSFFNQCDEPELKVSGEIDANRQAEAQHDLEALESAKKELIASLPKTVAEWEASLDAGKKATLPGNVIAALKVSENDRTTAQNRAIENEFQGHTAGRIKALDARIKKMKKESSTAVTTLVMSERTAPRPNFIFIKGDFTRHGDPVSPAVPAVLPQISARSPTRLDLARWIVDPNNPLTARVTVNRIWQHYFGVGLVDTENDFGSQGSLPSNPQLLDWLAMEFMHPSDPATPAWSQKAIHRLIVTSAVYQQASTARPELAEADPYNRMLARQSRIRVDAEIVRDIGLEASGLLSEKIGGPSVFPPQPDGVTNVGQVSHPWKTSTGEDRYRRGMYTFLFRASPNPLLSSFDASNATAACTRRMRSNTPLQALIEMNGEAAMESVRAMAGRVVRECKGSDAERIDYAFRLATSRQPALDESAVLLRVLKQQQATYAADAKSADLLAWTDRPKGVDAPTMAAWTIVCRVILNLDETITRE